MVTLECGDLSPLSFSCETVPENNLAPRSTSHEKESGTKLPHSKEGLLAPLNGRIGAVHRQTLQLIGFAEGLVGGG